MASSLKGLYNDNANKSDGRHYVEKVNDNVLMSHFKRSGSSVQTIYYDFMNRTVLVLVNGSNHDRTLTFAEVDPEVLKLHRDILIELGGHPQPLPDAMAKPRLGASPSTP